MGYRTTLRPNICQLSASLQALLLEASAGDVGEGRRNRVADLDILLRPRPLKEIIIGKTLRPCRFAHRPAAALTCVVVNKRMAVFRDVAGHGHRRFQGYLRAKAIIEEFMRFTGRPDIFMFGQEVDGKIGEFR